MNNLSFNSSEESIRSVFEKFGNILEVRLICDKITQKPKGYCYIEFQDEHSVDKVLENKNNFIIDERKIIVKRSQSVTKLREHLRHTAHVSNLPFQLTEEQLKKVFIKSGIDKERIIDCLIVKDENLNSKGFGFVEFDNEVI